jgi:hypothetical protein
MLAGSLKPLRIISLICLAATSARAQLANETLLVGLPAGYKVGFQAKNAKTQITEYVPQNEDVEGWTQMVTVQIFFGAHFTPAEFEQTISESWKRACPEAVSAHISDGAENNYPFSFWLETCANNPKTGKPEMTWMKGIAGRDSFYLVQKAFKYEPGKDEISAATQYLRGVQVCDTRGTEHPCPDLKKL